jgi:hypothetical protein
LGVGVKNDSISFGCGSGIEHWKYFVFVNAAGNMKLYVFSPLAVEITNAISTFVLELK